MRAPDRLIAIGASAGGVTALQYILQNLRPDFDIPIAVVQHLPPKSRLDVTKVYGTRTERSGEPQRDFRIVEIEDKMPIEAGHVYMATPNYHLLVETDGAFSLSQDEWVHYSRPSIDVFFTSVAESMKKQAVGVLLTGANHDGAQGLRTISERGGCTIIQDPAEAECDTMPRAGLAAFKPNYVLSLSEIAGLLNQMHASEVVL